MPSIEAGVNFQEIGQKFDASQMHRFAVRRLFVPGEPEFDDHYEKLLILAKDMGTQRGALLEALENPELFLKLVRTRDDAIKARPLDSYTDYPGAKFHILPLV